jgi:hypothetical protein
MGIQAVVRNEAVPVVAPVEGNLFQVFCEKVKGVALSVIQAIGDILGKIFSCFRGRAEAPVEAEDAVADPVVHLELPEPIAAPPVAAPPAYEEPLIEYYRPVAPGEPAALIWKNKAITMSQLTDTVEVYRDVKHCFEALEAVLEKPEITAEELRDTRLEISQLFSSALGKLLTIWGPGRENSVLDQYNEEMTILANRQDGLVDVPVQNIEKFLSDMEKVLDRAPFNETKEGVEYLGNNLHRFVEFDQRLEARQKYLGTPKGIAEAVAHRLKDKVVAAPVGSSLAATGAAGLVWAVVGGSSIGLAVSLAAVGIQAHRKGLLNWPRWQRDERPEAPAPVVQQYVPVEPVAQPEVLNQYVPVPPHQFDV